MSCLQLHSFPHVSSLFSFFALYHLLNPHLFRLAFEKQEASHYYQNPREVSSTHSSPYKTLPRPPRDPRSMPPTPVMTRNAYSSSQLRCDISSPALFTPAFLHFLIPKPSHANLEPLFCLLVTHPEVQPNKIFHCPPGQRGLLIASDIAVGVWSRSPS